MDGSSEEVPRLAASKNAEAVALIARGRFQDALRALNDAIYSAPDYPHSYATRARVFESLGMVHQAEADRQKAMDLARSGGYSETDLSPPVRGIRRRPTTRRPRYPRREAQTDAPGGRGSRLGETFVIVLGLLGIGAIAGGIFVGARALDQADIDLNIFDFETFRESEPEATSAVTPPPTPEPTPPPVTPPPEALNGNPFSYSNIESAWKGKGITVTLGAVSGGFSGFKGAPFDVRLTRGGDSASLSVFVYGNRDGPKEDWNLSAGSRPSAKSGRVVPAHDSIWWNTNVIVVSRSSGGDVGRDALAAVLALGG